jgi:hypothetical protein
MLDFTKEDDDKEPHRLVDMIVQEVSIVDRPANQRRFLIVKRRTPMEGAQVVQKDDGTLTAKQEGDIPAPVKESVLTTVTAAVERLLSVAEALRSAPTTDAQVDQPLPDNLAGTVADVARELAGVGERYPSPASKAVAKADPIPEPVKAAVVTQLKQAADRLAAVLAAVTGAPSTTEQMDAPLPATITDEVIGIAHALAGVCEKYPSPVAAAEAPTPDGQGTTKAEAEPAPAEPVTVADATTVVPVADAAPAEPAVPAEPAAAPAAAQAPATGPTAEDVAKAMSEQVAARLATQFERLSAIVKGVQERVEKVERAEGLPNSQPAQGSEQPTNKNGQDETFWPADLNDARLARPNPEKAPSGSPSPTL